MDTPSLQRRVVISGSVIVLAALLVFGTTVYLALLQRLEQTLDEVLDARLAIAIDLAGEIDDTEALVQRLSSAGLPATILTVGGTEHHAEPALPRFGVTGTVGPPTVLPHPRVSRSAVLPDGRTVTVHATRTGVDSTLRSLLVVLAIGSAVVLVSAALLLQRSSRRALAPLGVVVSTAERTAAGQLGERLHADQPKTDLGRMAVAYDRMLDSLEEALRESREAEERTRRFVADAAHQLRTPIAGLRSAIEVLLRSENAADRDRMFAHAIRETNRATGLVDGLLRLARFESGPVLASQPVDLAEILRSELQRLRSAAPHLEVTFESTDHRLIVVVEATAVTEALANLLDNAGRHARSTISTSLAATDGPDGTVVEVRIHDDGPGLRAGAEERAFERFATFGEHRGSGLGLPIARAVARAHGGDLQYRGGTFVLWLPASPEGTPHAEARSVTHH